MFWESEKFMSSDTKLKNEDRRVLVRRGYVYFVFIE